MINVKNARCERCRKEVSSFSMSYMNTDIIGSDCCKDKEEAHPLYQIAKDVERLELLKGNHNYAGLFGGETFPFKERLVHGEKCSMCDELAVINYGEMLCRSCFDKKIENGGI